MSVRSHGGRQPVAGIAGDNITMQEVILRKLIGLIVALVAGLGCSDHSREAIESTQPQAQPAVTAPAAEECHPVTWIEIVHRVGSTIVTDRLRLTDEAAAVPSLALRSFQVAADHFGADTIVSSRPITQVQCFTPQTVESRGIRAVDPPSNATVCVDWNGVPDCTQVVPNHSYDYTGTETCTVTNYVEAVSLSCEDSSAIVTRKGDVVLTINTQSLRDDIAARTQVLRRLVGDANVLTNIHFDVVLTPDQQASIVGNDAYTAIAQAVQQAANAGQPLPDIGQLLHNLPQPPQNIDFYAQLLKAYQTKLDRLSLLAQITNGRLLTAAQVNAFYQNFVGKSNLIDRLTVDHSPAALNQAMTQINDTINQLATVDPVSTVYEQVKAGAQSLLEAHTSSGVFDPDNVLDFVVPNLYQSLTDDDVEKQVISSDLLNDFNKQLQRSDGQQRAHDMNGPLRMLTPAMQSGDMDTAWRLYDQVKATEFFFDHTDPTGTSFNVHLTPDAAAMFNITIEPSSSRAYEVINLLNETADFNAATGKVTVDFQAIITLNARSALATDDLYRALYHTEESYGVLSFLQNAAGAIVAGALAELAADATGVIGIGDLGWSGVDAVVNHLTTGIANWRQAQDLVLQLGGDIIDHWPGMTPAQKAELVAQIAGQIIQTLPTPVLGASAVQAALDAAVRAHLDLAARGLAIIERTGFPLAEDAAVELVKQLDAEGITALDEAIDVADALDDALPCDIVGSQAPAFAGMLSPAGRKPPCPKGMIREVFEQFKAHANSSGFTIPEDIRDLLKSAERTGFPGEVIKNAMDEKEYSFANEIINREGGVMVGNRRGNRDGIDGFYQGLPIQLKDASDKSDVASVIGALKLAWKKAANYKDLSVFIRCQQYTKDAVRNMFPLQQGPDYMNDGRVTTAHFLTADGWLDVFKGVFED